MWYHKIKWKIVAPLLIIAVLVGVFYFGGNAPGSRGWEIGSEEPAVVITPAPTPTPAPSEEPATETVRDK